MFRKSVGALLGVFLLALGSVSTASAAETRIVKFMSAPFGTGAYVIGAALEDITRKHHPWLRIVALEGRGSLYNIRKLNTYPLERKQDTFILTSFVAPIAAQNALGAFEKKWPEEMLTLGFSWNLVMFYATMDPSIKTLADLEGKKVAIGFKTQDSWGFLAAAWLEQGAGLKDKIDLQYVGLKQARASFLDGKVDAIVVGGYVDPVNNAFVPTPATRELLAAGRDLNYVEISKDAVERAAANLANIPALSYTLPAGALKGHDKEITGSFVGVAWYATPSFPEDLAYEVTKVIVEHSGKLDDYHAVGKMVTPGSVVWPIKNIEGVKVHPGSRRALKDAGLLD